MNVKVMLCLCAAVGCMLSCRKAETRPAPAPRLSLDPSSAILTCGQSMRFGYRAEAGVALPLRWQVTRGEGASIGPDGTFKAPEHPGLFTVQAESAGGAGILGQARIRVVSRPEGTIIASKWIRAHARGVRAEVPAQPDTAYRWSIQGGQARGRTDQPGFGFDAGEGPLLLLRCQVTNAAGDSLTSSLELPVLPKAELKLRPGRILVSTGETFRFGYDLTGKADLPMRWWVVQPDGGTIDGQGTYTAPDHPGRFTVQVSQSPADPGGAGPHGTPEDEAVVEVVGRPTGRIEVAGLLHPGSSCVKACVPQQEGMTYHWEVTGGRMVAGQQASCLQVTVGTGPFLTLVCRVSNAAGASLELTKRLEVSKAEP